MIGLVGRMGVDGWPEDASCSGEGMLESIILSLGFIVDIHPCSDISGQIPSPEQLVHHRLHVRKTLRHRNMNSLNLVVDLFVDRNFKRFHVAFHFGHFSANREEIFRGGRA